MVAIGEYLIGNKHNWKAVASGLIFGLSACRFKERNCKLTNNNLLKMFTFIAGRSKARAVRMI